MSARSVKFLARGSWFFVGAELVSTASWPNVGTRERVWLVVEDIPSFDDRVRGSAVRHQDELLGATTVRMPANEPLGPAQEKLLGDVAAQAGLVLRNVRLLEDLRASRKRIVTAQDERARALERNIHDSAQQQLVALTVKLRLAQGFVATDPTSGDDARGAPVPDAVRARGPSESRARDLPTVAGRQGAARRDPGAGPESGAPGHARRRRPVSPDAEAAIYFCALEALQNAAKYAGASRIRVNLAEIDGMLQLEVADDGTGFDTDATPRGAGLQNMADRLEALGGSLDMVSAPGSGTSLIGRIPVGRKGSR